MVLGSEVDSVEVRFGLYIDELHDFLAGRGMHFGYPDDLLPFAERLSGPSFFRDELSSMMRAVIFREAEGIDREELVELLAVSVGGPEIILSAPKLQSTLDQLRTFLGTVLRSLFRSFPDEDEIELEPERASATPQQQPSIASPTPTLAAPVLAASAFAPPIETTTDPLAPEPASTDDMLSRARAALDRAAHPATSTPNTPAAVHPLPPIAATAPPNRRNLWIAAACGILLGLTGGVMLRQHAPVLEAPVISDLQSPVPLPSDTPKPSPYELPVRNTEPSRYEIPQPNTNTPPPNAAPATPRTSTRPIQPVAPSLLTTRTPRQLRSVPRPVPPTALLGARPTPRPSAALNTYPRTRVLSAAVPGPTERSATTFSPSAQPRYASETPTVFIGSSGIMTANLLYAPAPEYPRTATTEGIEGRVVLQALIWHDGSVVQTQVLRGDRSLAAAAQDAVRHWRYRPYLLAGRPAEIATVITVDFRLPR